MERLCLIPACTPGVVPLGLGSFLKGITLAHVRAILGIYWGNLLGVRPYGYNPGTLDESHGAMECQGQGFRV